MCLQSSLSLRGRVRVGAYSLLFILSLSKDERPVRQTPNRCAGAGGYTCIPSTIPFTQGRARAISRTPWGVVMGAKHRSPMHT